MVEEEFVKIVADLLNRTPDPKERERRVREANRQLYRQVVGGMNGTTTTQADLALARAAELELQRRHEKG